MKRWEPTSAGRLLESMGRGHVDLIHSLTEGGRVKNRETFRVTGDYELVPVLLVERIKLVL